MGRAAAPRRRLALIAAVAASLLCGDRAFAAGIDTSIAYLHIEANEGGSSGGHVALDIEGEVFHFQQEQDGLLRLRTDPRRVFRIRYALLENRPVHVTHIAVSADATERLRRAFTQRALVEEAEEERRAALAADVALFASWQRRGRGDAVSFPVRAAGYFFEPEFGAGSEAAGGSPALAAVRAQVRERSGVDALPKRIAAVRAELAALDWRAARPTSPGSHDNLPNFPPTVATRYRELIEQLTALEVLQAAPALHPAALVLAGPPLGAGERTALEALRDRMATALAALSGSSRPDWGYALLLGMARLAAIEWSLATGQLAVLDAWPANAPAPPLPDGDERQRAFFAALQEQTEGVYARARAACLSAPDCIEREYTRLETAMNRHVEVRDAVAAGRAPRVGLDPLLPARTASRRDLAVPRLPITAVVREAEISRATLEGHVRHLQAVRGYNLLTRNCVSELLAMMREAFAGDGDVQTAERAALGGGVGREPWNAIPFVSAASVGNAYRVTSRETWPSFMQQARASKAREQTWGASLAEATAWRSTAYRAGPDDSAFLFFTDGAAVMRPILGAFNVGAGVIGSAIGLITWPVDGGRLLERSSRGILYSAPELIFINLRKGTTAWLTADELRAVDDGPRGAEHAAAH